MADPAPSCPSPSPFDASPPHPSAASTQVYNIPELRSRILHFLGRKDLAAFMRVEKKGMALVARELYATMDYKHVRYRMSVFTPRRRLYCDAVSVIDARNLSLTPAMIEQLNFDDSSDIPEEAWRRQEWLQKWAEEYEPKLLELLIPGLRKKCPALRSIMFGKPYDVESTGREAEDFWVVHLDRAEEDGAPASKCVDIGSGHVDHFLTRAFSLAAAPPTPHYIESTTPKPPSDRFALRSRFDLRLGSKSRNHDPAYHQQWLTSLREDPHFANVYKMVYLDVLPVNLELLAGLYKRQAATGHADRIQHIVATSITPWSLPDLRSFATVASTSLVRLILARKRRQDAAGPKAGSTTIWPKNLPRLISIIRELLPNIRVLHFGMKGMKEAEQICGGLLTKETLSSGGSVTELKVYTSGGPYKPFNTLRCLSALLTNNASAFLVGVGKDQSNFVRYLRSQSPARRVHLSTVDFATLGITTLGAVLDLTYDEDGRPRHRLAAQAAKWTEEALDYNDLVENSIIPHVRSGINQFLAASRQIIPNPSSTSPHTAPVSPVHALEQMRLQLDAIEQFEAAGQRMAEMVGKAQQSAEEIRAAMKVLEDAEGSGGGAGAGGGA